MPPTLEAPTGRAVRADGRAIARGREYRSQAEAVIG